MGRFYLVWRKKNIINNCSKVFKDNSNNNNKIKVSNRIWSGKVIKVIRVVLDIWDNDNFFF